MIDDPREVPFEVFYKTYVARVWRYVRMLAPRSRDAEDIVQEVFVVAARMRATIEDPRCVTAWLFGVARNIVANRNRLAWSKHVRLAADESSSTFEDPRAPRHDVLEDDRHRLLAVVQVVAALDERLRVPWEMKYFERFELEEIAVRCGCSLAQVKRRIAEAERGVMEAVR